MNRNPVFPQVLIPPLGRSTKPETEADGRGGDPDLNSGSKSTPARGTRRLRPERVMGPLYLQPPVDLSTSSICPFSNHFPPHAHLLRKSPPQCTCLGFHLIPLPQLSLHQPQFSHSIIGSGRSRLPCLPPAASPILSSLSSCWQTPQRYGKGGQLCHNIGSHFIATALGLPACRIDGLGVFHWPREELRRADFPPEGWIQWKPMTAGGK